MTDKHKMLKFIGELFMLALCAIFVLPLYYLLVSTFKPQVDIVNTPLAPPIHFTLAHYQRALANMSFFRNFGNSALITTTSVILIVIIGSMAAYSIARRRSKINKFLEMYFLLGFLIPIQTTMIPLFFIMKNLQLMNTYAGLIFLHCNGSIFAFFMFRGFVNSIPLELEESAIIDGCSVFQTFWRIVFPLLKPITVTVVIFNTMWIWNDFILTFLFISSSKKATLILQVYNGVGLYFNDWSLMMPVLVLALAPMVVFYLLLQKHIMSGLTSGAIKA